MQRRTLVGAIVSAVVLAVGVWPTAHAGTFTESNPLYDLKVTYGFEGDRVWHEVAVTNKLEIQIRYGHVDATLLCASGARHAATIGVPGADLPAGESRSFRVEGDGCSPTTRRDPATGRSVKVDDSIRGVDYSGRITMAQHGAGFVALTWDCGDEEILVTAIKFPRGTGFKLIASNDRSMTSAGKLDPHAAIQHLCGTAVEDPDAVTQGIRELMGKVRTFCTKAPQFCDKAYDVNNKRASGVRG